MDSKTIREKYLNFFKERGHTQIDPAPLVLENDPTTLFTSAGMQPLVPNLKGLPHPAGKRLTNSQPIFRSQDIEEVGDNRHTTFFEMLGNWSLGDYFKTEQLTWVWEFLKELNLPKEKLHVSVFEGTNEVPRDNESFKIWKSLGVMENHIHFYPAQKNWWSLSGAPEHMKEGEIGGPDSEIFYEFTQVEHNPKFGEKCHPNCDCGRFLEIGNSVFIQYQKQSDGSLTELPQKNVDFGGGLERLVAATNDNPDIFQIDLFSPVVEAIEQATNSDYKNLDHQAKIRIVADHIRAAAFLIIDGVIPSNKLHGYVLRRLLRRTAVKIDQLKKDPGRQVDMSDLCLIALNAYPGNERDTTNNKKQLRSIVLNEMLRFYKNMQPGFKELEKADIIDGKFAFDLFQTYGFPLEVTQEVAREKGKIIVNEGQFKQEFEKHKELSRTASIGMFKGGLASTGEEETKYHTATHLLHAALRQVLGNHVIQRGSNITAERMRFDFSHDEKLTDDQLKKTEDLVNEQIQKDLHVSCYETTPETAKKDGAIAAFGDRYGERVKVYSIGDFSKEICGGPHAGHTGVLGRFRIQKEESAGAGIRRIYAVLS